MLHRVVDRECRRDRSTGRIDVHFDIFVGALRIEEKELCNNSVRELIINRPA